MYQPDMLSSMFMAELAVWCITKRICTYSSILSVKSMAMLAHPEGFCAVTEVPARP